MERSLFDQFHENSLPKKKKKNQVLMTKFSDVLMLKKSH
jgi:hypothetical protein